MIVSCFPTGIVNRERPGQGIVDIKKAGFSNVVLDFSMYCTEDENAVELEKVIEPIVDKCKKEDVAFSLAIAPYLRRDTTCEDNGLLVELTKECIRICGMVGCKYLTVRPLFAGIADKDAWKVNKEFYLSLAPLAKEHDVRILLENQCKDVNGHLVKGICSDGRTATEWVDSLNAELTEKRFGFCMDVGVCNLCGQNMYDFVDELGDRIKAVILCDCDGSEENAMLPFTCVNKRSSQTDWLNLIRGLRDIGFDGLLALNITDTAAAFSPILRPMLLQLAKEVVEYFKWQISIESLLKKYPSVVLFGAGNMCRNYMKCYGETYPPLFTCDNNKALWGTSFCGLEVKNPESLMDIPQDCAVFICNIYYREIEQQLREMGIKNPIEYFNDEYMPAFYFDRLEDGGKR